MGESRGGGGSLLWVSLGGGKLTMGESRADTRINRGRRGTAISGIWPSRSRYRENDRDNRDKWNPKKYL